MENELNNIYGNISTKEDFIYIKLIAVRREWALKNSNSTNGITLHAGQARPFSEIDNEDEGAERQGEV